VLHRMDVTRLSAVNASRSVRVAVPAFMSASMELHLHGLMSRSVWTLSPSPAASKVAVSLVRAIDRVPDVICWPIMGGEHRAVNG
jgi:hypothetical protein